MLMKVLKFCKHRTFFKPQQCHRSESVTELCSPNWHNQAYAPLAASVKICNGKCFCNSSSRLLTMVGCTQCAPDCTQIKHWCIWKKYTPSPLLYYPLSLVNLEVPCMQQTGNRYIHVFNMTTCTRVQWYWISTRYSSSELRTQEARIAVFNARRISENYGMKPHKYASISIIHLVSYFSPSTRRKFSNSLQWIRLTECNWGKVGDVYTCWIVNQSMLLSQQ